MMKKRIVCDYTFNYFGGEQFEGKRITGAGVLLTIKVYKDGKEIFFEDNDEPKAGNRYISDAYEMFLKNGQLVIQKNLFVEKLFQDSHGWNKIEAEVTGYFVNTACDSNGWEEKLPADFQNTPPNEPVVLTKQLFDSFLTHNINDLGTSDDKRAQAPCIRFCNAW